MLLKDNPEFKETIENNVFLSAEIADILSETECDIEIDEDFDSNDIKDEVVELLEKAEFEFTIEDNKIQGKLLYSDTLAENIVNLILKSLDTDSFAFEITNKKVISESIIEHIKGFVDHNYGLSQKEVYNQTSNFL